MQRAPHRPLPHHLSIAPLDTKPPHRRPLSPAHPPLASPSPWPSTTPSSQRNGNVYSRLPASTGNQLERMNPVPSCREILPPGRVGYLADIAFIGLAAIRPSQVSVDPASTGQQPQGDRCERCPVSRDYYQPPLSASGSFILLTCALRVGKPRLWTVCLWLWDSFPPAAR